MTVWILLMAFTWNVPSTRQIDDIASKQECIALAEDFIEAAQLTRDYVNYICLDHPAGTHCGRGFPQDSPAAKLLHDYCIKH